MTMQSSGPISIGQAQAECRGSGQVSASNADLSRLAGVSSGARYAWSYWYGKSYGYQIIQTTTNYYNTTYHGANSINFVGYMFLNFGPPNGTEGNTGIFGRTGGDDDRVGYFQQSPGPGGGIMFGLYRRSNLLTIMIMNGSLDGCTFVTSLGEAYSLTNDYAYSWDVNGNRFTSYGVYPTIAGQGAWGDYVQYSYQVLGTPVRPQPAPPPAGGGGGWDNPCCFPAGSMVLLASGVCKPIETLEDGEWLASPCGPVQMKRLYRTYLGHKRRMLSFHEDTSMLWSEEHPFWARQGQQQGWWSVNPELLRKEMVDGVIVGLKDPNKIFSSQTAELAHIDEGFTHRTPMELVGYGPETPLFVPVLDGPPAIVNGYVVGAFLNEHECDYSKLDWDVSREGLLVPKQ